VTSNPSPAYVERVAKVFNNDCSGLYPQGCTNVGGNLKLVVQAILLDPEARGDLKTDPNYGKLREPVQYVNGFLRAFNVNHSIRQAPVTVWSVAEVVTSRATWTSQPFNRRLYSVITNRIMKCRV